MTCARCNAEAVVKRGNAAYCAKCALARDWEEIVMIVQEDRVEVAAPAVEFGESGAPQDAAAERAAKAAVAEAQADPDSNGELPADPFT